MSAAVYLHPAKQGTIKRGHPWIFPKAIKRQEGHPKTSELIDIFTDEGERFGVGVYNEHSLYRVRVLASNAEVIEAPTLAAIVTLRLRQACKIRELLNLPNVNTTAYRLFNSEGDGLSGLTIDRFNQVCVVSSSAHWVETHKSLILDALLTQFPKDKLIWLPQVKALAQDGWQGVIEDREEYDIEVIEAGIYYKIDFSNAQKTGLFLDQRDNHVRIAELASGKRVLDLYTYTGGFALHAARANASMVTAVDSSPQAIASAKINAALNDITSIDWIEGDARDYLAQAGNYDIIILDPPKLAPSQQHLQRAKNYYRFLHREVFKAMHPGSLIMTCNCSSALSSPEFAELAYAQARMVGKSARVLGIYGPATCHSTIPAFPEGNYLTAVLLAVV